MPVETITPLEDCASPAFATADVISSRRMSFFGPINKSVYGIQRLAVVQ